MSKIVAIFAHPDDESMGPGGTLAKLSQNTDVYLICLTRGEAGGGQANLGQIRTKELAAASKILGIKEIFVLAFPDGKLSTQPEQQVLTKIEVLLEQLQPQVLITFEPKGFTGHKDHILVGQITKLLFNKLVSVQTLLLYCMSSDQQRLMKDYFIQVPPGYSKDQVDLVEDVSSVWETKLQAIQAHKSQKEDVKRVLEELKRLPQEEYFLVETK